MHHGDGPGLVRVCVHLGRGTMGGPAGVTDAGFTGQRMMHQQIREIDQLAHGAPTVEPSVVQRGDPGAVIAAIFQPPQRLDKDRGGLVIAQNSDNSAHQSVSFWFFRAFCARNSSNNLRASPGFSTCRARPMAKAPAATSCVITEPEPVIASSPTETGATSIVFEPMNTRSPMRVSCFITPS